MVENKCKSKALVGKRTNFEGREGKDKIVEVDKFIYLGVMIGKDGCVYVCVGRRSNQ